MGFCHWWYDNVPLSLKTAAEKEQSASQEAVTRLYCVDENIERRNHYLDLAGIENFTSKFDDTGVVSAYQNTNMILYICFLWK